MNSVIVFGLLVFLVMGGMAGYAIAANNPPLSGQKASITYSWRTQLPAYTTAFRFNISASSPSNNATSVLTILRSLNQSAFNLIRVPVQVTQMGDLRLKGKVLTVAISYVVNLAYCNGNYYNVCSTLNIAHFQTTGKEMNSITFEASS